MELLSVSEVTIVVGSLWHSPAGSAQRLSCQCNYMHSALPGPVCCSLLLRHQVVQTARMLYSD